MSSLLLNIASNKRKPPTTAKILTSGVYDAFTLFFTNNVIAKHKANAKYSITVEKPLAEV